MIQRLACHPAWPHSCQTSQSDLDPGNRHGSLKWWQTGWSNCIYIYHAINSKILFWINRGDICEQEWHFHRVGWYLWTAWHFHRVGWYLWTRVTFSQGRVICEQSDIFTGLGDICEQRVTFSQGWVIFVNKSDIFTGWDYLWTKSDIFTGLGDIYEQEWFFHQMGWYLGTRVTFIKKKVAFPKITHSTTSFHCCGHKNLSGRLILRYSPFMSWVPDRQLGTSSQFLVMIWGWSHWPIIQTTPDRKYITLSTGSTLHYQQEVHYIINRKNTTLSTGSTLHYQQEVRYTLNRKYTTLSTGSTLHYQQEVQYIINRKYITLSTGSTLNYQQEVHYIINRKYAPLSTRSLMWLKREEQIPTIVSVTSIASSWKI